MVTPTIDAAFLSSATHDQLLQVMAELFDTPVPELNGLIEELFKRMDAGQLKDWPGLESFLKLSDTYAVSMGTNFPITVSRFKQHEDEQQWTGFDSADLKFDMKNFDPSLRDKIIADIKRIAGTDKVEDKDSDGHVVGIKISDPIAKANMEIYLAHLSAPEVGKSAKKVKSIPAQLLKDVGWAAWQDTWDSFQKTVISKAAGGPEEAGKAFCEGIFLMPFKGAVNLMNKLDKWIIKRAQLAKKARESGAPDTPGTPDTPDTPTPDTTDPDSISAEEYAGTRLEFYKVMDYQKDLRIALMHEAPTNPKAKELADAIEEMLTTQAPPTHYSGDFGKDLNDFVPYLLANPANRDLHNSFDGLPASAMSDDIKNDYRKKAANIAFGLTPDGKEVIDNTTFDTPTVNPADTVLHRIETVTSPEHGNGTKTTYKTPTGELTEETYKDPSGNKVVITKYDDVYLEKHLNASGALTAQTLKKGNNSISVEAPDKLGTIHEGHTCPLHQVPNTAYTHQVGNINLIAGKIEQYKQDIHGISRPDPALTGPDRFVQAAADTKETIAKEYIQKGISPSGCSSSKHDHKKSTGRSDGSVYGLVIDPAKHCTTHYSQKDATKDPDCISCFPKNNIVVKIVYGKNNKPRTTVYDLSKTPPTRTTGKGTPQNVSVKEADRWRNFLRDQNQLLDAHTRNPSDRLITDALSNAADMAAIMSKRSRGRTP